VGKHLRYSDNLDYLTASIIYLGTQEFWWARTPHNMANELSLDEARLSSVFEGFPGIFRRSSNIEPKTKQRMYSLQARYAQKQQDDPADAQISYIRPLDMDKVRVLLDFVFKAADDERTRRHAFVSNWVAVGAAVVSAFAAIFAAYIKS
jgi:hypothetical protein